jgi:hypothetical protein
MRTLRLAVAAALTLGAAGAGAQVTTIYSNDFATTLFPPGFTATWSATNAPTIVGYGGLSTLGNANRFFFLGEGATLGFTGLAAYTSGTVSFDVHLWDTWDDGTGCCGPDMVRFNVNGAADLLNSAFVGGPRGTTPASFSFTFGPGSGTLNLNWLAATTQTDEGFTIDNVNVAVDFAPAVGVVPEPSTYALLATGLLALGGIARRRRHG